MDRLTSPRRCKARAFFGAGHGAPALAALAALALALGGCGTSARSTAAQTSQRTPTTTPQTQTTTHPVQATTRVQRPTGTATSGSRSSMSMVATGPTFTVTREPAAGVAPFISMIASAKHTVALTMYELYDGSVEQALAAAAARGVAVRVLLDGGYYGDRDEENGAAFAYLQSHGVEVRYTPSYFALTHQKTLTIDSSESAIMTLNFDGKNSTTRDYAVIDRQSADVRTILSVFNGDWAGRQITPPATGDLVFSPQSQYTYTDLIASAKRSIALEAEELSYRPVITQLCVAARYHVQVRIVMSYDKQYTSALKHLEQCGASVRLYHGESYFIHAKLLVIDGSQALVGSQNLTTTSLEDNRELSILLSAPTPVDQLLADFNADYNGA